MSSRQLFSTIFVVLVAAALAAPTFGAKPSLRSTGACTVSEGLVSATGLPTGEVVNFMVTDANGTYGRVLGFTDDGTWSVAVPAAEGAARYEFTSRTWGPSGSRYTVFASC